jgi:DNA-directed RNA polymerase specialized sigma24 family protein
MRKFEDDADNQKNCCAMSETDAGARIGARAHPMTGTLNPLEYASIDEVIAALDALTPEELLRLRQLAKLRSATLVVMGWEDLLNEAIKRALEGARAWPKTVPFMAFMVQTMRSVASEERRELQANATVAEADLFRAHSSSLPLDELAVDEVDPARAAETRQLLRSIECLFADDPAAQCVLHGFGLGSSPEEIQRDSGMTPTQYASTQRRIRRALARL